MSQKRDLWITTSILLAVSAVLTYSYFFLVEEPNLRQREKLHMQILSATAVSPYRYRVLAPLVSEGMTQAFSLVIPHNWAFYLAYGILDFTAIFVFLTMLYLYLREWFTWEQALLGILFTGATMPMALRDHYFQPWSLLEAGFFAASLFAIRKNWKCVLLILITLASLTRETAIFIPLTFLLGKLNLFTRSGGKRRIDQESLLWFGTYLLTWLVITGGLRFLLGPAPALHTVSELLAKNTKPINIARTLINWALLLGPFWLFAALGWRKAPEFLKRVSLIIPVYVVTIAVWGVWYEVRLLLPLYPILIPLGLVFLFNVASIGQKQIEPL
jgi:hypothetical protein